MEAETTRQRRRTFAIRAALGALALASLAVAVFLSVGSGSVERPYVGGDWQAASEELPGGVSTVAASPDDPKVVYAGALDSEEALVFRSEDGVESWQARN